MNKREMLHTLIDKLLDIEESSKKGVRFNYSNTLLSIYFKERDTEGDFIGKNTHLFFSIDPTNGYLETLANIESVSRTPDVEPKVSVLLTQEKARELGLIA